MAGQRPAFVCREQASFLPREDGASAPHAATAFELSSGFGGQRASLGTQSGCLVVLKREERVIFAAGGGCGYPVPGKPWSSGGRVTPGRGRDQQVAAILGPGDQALLPPPAPVCVWGCQGCPWKGDPYQGPDGPKKLLDMSALPGHFCVQSPGVDAGDFRDGSGVISHGKV